MLSSWIKIIYFIFFPDVLDLTHWLFYITAKLNIAAESLNVDIKSYFLIFKVWIRHFDLQSLQENIGQFYDVL